MQDAQTHIASTSPEPRRVRAAVVTLLALGLPALANGPATRPAFGGDTIVRLRPTAVVTGDDVTLADVADLDAEARELAGDWPVAAAPHAGASGAVDVAHLQSVLARRGVNLSSWIFRGASRCVVSKPAASASSRSNGAATARSAADPSQPGTLKAPTTRPALDEAQAVPPPPDPRTLEGVIHAHLHERLVGQEGVLGVRFSPAVTRLLGLSTKQYQFRITDRGEKPLGMVALEVAVLEGGATRQVVQVLCEATLRKPVVVAGRSFNRGEIIQADELRTEVRAFDRLDNIGLADPAPVIGQRARRLIKVGEQLDPRDVEAVPLVERNDLVTVSVRRGGLTITAAARAMGSGSYGDTVSLRSESSREMFIGVVTGPKTVELATDNRVADAGGKP